MNTIYRKLCVIENRRNTCNNQCLKWIDLNTGNEQAHNPYPKQAGKEHNLNHTKHLHVCLTQRVRGIEYSRENLPDKNPTLTKV